MARYMLIAEAEVLYTCLVTDEEVRLYTSTPEEQNAEYWSVIVSWAIPLTSLNSPEKEFVYRLAAVVADEQF